MTFHEFGLSYCWYRYSVNSKTDCMHEGFIVL